MEVVASQDMKAVASYNMLIYFAGLNASFYGVVKLLFILGFAGRDSESFRRLSSI